MSFDDTQVSSQASDAAEFKVACLCNLAYACIKLGSMDEAEKACFQALHMRPANAKALFRRGQARLALGRPVEAASDFSEVYLLEPNNAEVAKMLCLAQAGGENARRGQETSPAVGTSPRESEGGKSEPAVPTIHRSEEALPRETTKNIGSNNRNVMGVKPEKTEAGGGDVEQKNKVESSDISSAPPSGSSFMVSGWLDSAERKQGQHPRRGDNNNIDVHPRHHLDGSADDDRSPVSRPGGVEGVMSVSRLVLAQKGASKNAQDEPVASGPAAPAVQAEWSRLQAEEDIRVQESLRRWSTGGGTHAQEKTTKAGVKGKLVDAKEAKLKDKTAAKKIKSKTAKNASELWASLEEEENRVIEAFRAKLGVSEKLQVSSKEKVKEKRKNKNKSKER